MATAADPQYVRFQRTLGIARRQAGLTQAAVAKQLGKPQSYVSKCETGERRVDVLELAAFARIYGKPLDWFLPLAVRRLIPRPARASRKRQPRRTPR